MTDPNSAQRAREWLEHQLAELGQLRNATRRDQNFKQWRQHTLTVIQRIWPGDARRVDRFRRIPFSPPMSRSTDRQVRDYYERGWGEAGVLLREFLAEINLLGLPEVAVSGTEPGAETESAMGPMPALGAPAELQPKPQAAAEPEAMSGPEAPVRAEQGPDDIRRAMERLLSSSPIFRWRPAKPPRAQGAPAPAPGSPAEGLLRLAGELETLGVPPERVEPAREALLALARAAQSGTPAWELVSEALRHAGAAPELARRALPLLLTFVEKAA